MKVETEATTDLAVAMHLLINKGLKVEISIEMTEVEIEETLKEENIVEEAVTSEAEISSIVIVMITMVDQEDTKTHLTLPDTIKIEAMITIEDRTITLLPIRKFCMIFILASRPSYQDKFEKPSS